MLFLESKMPLTFEKGGRLRFGILLQFILQYQRAFDGIYGRFLDGSLLHCMCISE